jgi:tRNA-specific 2-thiouridylase
MSLLEAASVSEQDIAKAVALSPEREESAKLALDALHGALGDAATLRRGRWLSEPSPEAEEQGVLVGMSGGVDSAVAALLLKKQGHRVVGVTLRLWSDPGSRDDRSCCSPEAVRRARRTAHGLGIPHLTVDAGEAFHRDVVSYFVEEYGRGRTPNPCAKCNARLRFSLMLEIAEGLGLPRIATGHYSRMEGSPLGLMRGVDRPKDQSYVLAEVVPETLRRVLFPLGNMTKKEVRAAASEAGLEARSVPESQEICFVADDDHRRFLRERLGERPGAIVDLEGRQIGRHSGTYNFTVGQRKGLGIASQTPLYVVGVDADLAVVTAGSAEECLVGELLIGDVVLHRPKTAGPVAVQVRSSGPAIPARLRDETGLPKIGFGGEHVSIVLEEPASGVAPGQTAVLYEGGEVLLAGTILATGRWLGKAL